MKSKRVRNTIEIVIEIIIVAAIIFGGLMYVQNRLQSRGEKTTQGQGVDGENTAIQTEEEKGTGNYFIVVNKKKSATIIYEIDKDGNQNVVQVFQCSIGKDVKKKKTKISDKYSWVEVNNAWHKYNSRIGNKAWIQSVDFEEKYSWTLDKDSYNKLGNKQKAGFCILFACGDAQWIYENCGVGTKLEIINGSEQDILPMEPAAFPPLYEKCGWDPTDREENNPYLKQTNNTIVIGAPIVYVERTQKVKYLNNIIAIDSIGQNVTKKLKYKKFSSDTVGKKKVTFTYKSETGEKITQKVIFEVIDTINPVVKLSTNSFKYEVDSASLDDFQTSKVKEAIEELVKKKVSCDEAEAIVKVFALPKEQLQIGMNSVKVVATDPAGNIGACETMVELVVKEKKLNKKVTGPTKKKESKKKDSKKKKESETKEKQKEKEKKETTSEVVTEEITETTATLAE